MTVRENLEMGAFQRDEGQPSGRPTTSASTRFSRG